jgi:hypothetical protein
VLHTLVVHELKQHDGLQLVLHGALQFTLVLQLVLQLVSQLAAQLVLAQPLLQLSASASAGMASARTRNSLENCFIKKYSFLYNVTTIKDNSCR